MKIQWNPMKIEKTDLQKCPCKWEWAIACIALLLPLLAFVYDDTNSIIRCGIELGKSIFDGQFFDFYAYARKAQEAHLMMHPATYDIVFYITVGIWELPIAILEKAVGVLPDNIWVLAYSKLLLLVFALLSALMVYKIACALQISKANAKWAAFLFLTTGFLYAYIGVAGQYDIIGIFFTLWGVYFYIKKDMFKFVLLFTIAIQYKFFPLFVYIPFLLLATKKLFKIIVSLLPPVVSIFLLQFPFRNDGGAWADKTSLNVDMLDRILGNTITIFESHVPLSLLLVGGVCIYCYLKELTEAERNYYCIFIPFLSIALLFLSFPFFPYWIMYLAPWIALLFYMREDMNKKYFWIENGMITSILFAQYSHFYWVFETKHVKNTLVNLLFPLQKLPKDATLFQFASLSRLSRFENCVYGLYILCLVTIIYLYLPRSEMHYKTDNFPSRKIVWPRFAIQFLAGAFPLWLYLIYSIVFR